METANGNRVMRIIGWGGKKPSAAAIEEENDLGVLLDSVQQVSLALQEEYERSLAKMGRDVSQLATQVATLHPMVSRLKDEHSIDDKRNRILESEQARLKEQVSKALAELEHYRSLSTKLREQVDAASERESNDKNAIKTLKIDLEKALADIQERDGDLTYEKRKRSEIEHDRETMRSRLAKLEAEYFQAKRAIAKVLNDHGVVKGNLATRELELERALEDGTIERTARAQAEALLARSRHELEEAQRENRGKEKELRRLIEQYETEIQTLRAKKTNAENAEMALRGKVVLVQRLLVNQRAKTDKAYEHIGHLQESIRKLMSDEASRTINLEWEPDEGEILPEEAVGPELKEPKDEASETVPANQVVRLPVRDRNS
ncbi:hypothetical protein [Phyllobacterium leguminum]|uniref:Uncharacterized protein n=1 Tax=Phyllobacterium leguminum TaxID=314237 RepID=A0A318TAH0_9HYPH|nr:hypothetical protein [Phyllobacterium leguminum]PYE87828.1 hypothetical protein C7477_11011 [Phyllobacterium leguminum]